MNRSDSSLSPRVPWWLLLVPLVLSAALRDLWAPDEPRYAMIAKNAFDSGEFLVLRRCGELYPDKPPLVYWIAGLLGSSTNWNALSMRAVSIAAIAAVAWMTAKLAERWLGELEARWAPVMFLGFFMVLEIGGRLQLDPTLTFGCVGALYFATAQARDEREASRQVLLAGICAGIGMFAKGPVALVNLGLPLIAWRLCGLRASGPRASKAAWAGAILLCALPVATWASWASYVEPALARPLFFGQHLERAAKGTAHHGPPWQNLVRMPGQLMPWIVPVVYALGEAWRAFWLRRRGHAHHEGVLRAGLWFAVLFAFFSIIPAKRDMYLLSAYPACALLGAHRLANALRASRVGAWSAAVPIGMFTLLGVACAGFLPLAPVLAERFPKLAEPLAVVEELRDAHPSLIARASIVGALFLAGAIVATLAWRARRMSAWANAVCITWLAGWTALIALLVPVVDGLKSDRRIGELLASLPQRPSEVPCYGTAPDGPRFYGGAPCVLPDLGVPISTDLEARLAREGREFLALIEDSNWERVSAPMRERLEVRATDRVGSRSILVVGAR